MSIGRQIADIELNNSRAMREGQARYDSMTPDEEPEAVYSLRYQMTELEAAIGRAERALGRQDYEAARDYVLRASREAVEGLE